MPKNSEIAIGAIEIPKEFLSRKTKIAVVELVKFLNEAILVFGLYVCSFLGRIYVCFKGKDPYQS